MRAERGVMIDALVAGRLFGKPAQRTSKSGTSTFVTGKIRASDRQGESQFVSFIAFSRSAGEALLALDDGDSVALAGELTPKTWTDREGITKAALDLVAHQVLSEYHVARKRKAVAAEPAASEQPSQSEDVQAPQAAAPQSSDGEFDDDIPF
jgi:single-stranded DNA-binding protein